MTVALGQGCKYKAPYQILNSLCMPTYCTIISRICLETFGETYLEEGGRGPGVSSHSVGLLGLCC